MRRLQFRIVWLSGPNAGRETLKEGFEFEYKLGEISYEGAFDFIAIAAYEDDVAA